MPTDFVIGPQNSSGSREAEDIFVASMGDSSVIQYSAGSGNFKSTFTDKQVTTISGLVFGGPESVNAFLYAVGPYSGKAIVKFDQNNGTYIEHFEDKDLKAPVGMLYDESKLFVVDGHTIRTYDAETGEFLGVFSKHDGMEGTYLVIHSM